jgi:hypothetical protein
MRLFFHFANLYDGRNGKRLAFQKRYDDVCNEWLGGLTVLKYKSKIIGEQLGQHLDQLVRAGFLESYVIGSAKNGEGFVLSFRPGVTFFEDYERFYRRRHQGELQWGANDDRQQIGTPAECAANFTSLIESVLRSGSPEVPVYALAGNHDMYCGGVGYYDLIRQLNPEPLRQPASFFCLRSVDEKWQLLALDTGLHDYSPLEVDEAVTFVEDDELEWHCARLKEFSGRTILLSHHQLFSAFSPIGKAPKHGRRSASNPHLLKAFNLLTHSGRICAWFWGHEHTLSIYAPFAGLQRGRCLGHGAVPVSILDKLYDTVPDLDQAPTIVANTQLQQQGNVYAHGYATLTFEHDACSAEYFQDVDGQPVLIHSEIIQ